VTATLSLALIVGTDHRPFDRLVRWVDQWLGDHGGFASCFAQIGTAAPPQWCRWQRYLSRAETAAALQYADVVVCHGGPATIAAARDAGSLPVVVPRLRSGGEAVDDHQQRFARWAAPLGHLLLVETEPELRSLLDCALRDPSSFRTDAATKHSLDQTVARFEAAVGARLSARTEGAWRRRLNRGALKRWRAT
jgi:UDP-N-acetylglucosamine transferase subunit ALG13